MAEEHLPTERSLSEVAAEVYGDKYLEDPRAEPVRELQESRGPLTIDQAVGVLRQSREQQSEEPEEDEPLPAAAQAEDETPSEDDAPTEAALWTSDDVETLAQFQQAHQQLQQDLALYEQAKQIDLNALEKQDRSRAVALRNQIREAERELTERKDKLQAVAQKLVGKVQERQHEQFQRALAKQQAKLEKQLPDLDAKALRKYLVGVGFTNKDVDQAYDARLVVLAEKARRYDEMTSGKRKTVPLKGRSKPRKATRPQNALEIAQERFKRQPNVRNAADLLTARRRAEA